MANVTIDSNICSRCGMCVVSCSERRLSQPEKGATPVFSDAGMCISCGHCVAICPTEAFQHSSFPSGTVSPIQQDALPTSEQVIEMLRARRSVRFFKDKPVEQASIQRILEAACLAPSAHNFQTTEYVAVTDADALAKIRDLTVAYYASLARQVRNPLVRLVFRLAMGKAKVDSAAHLLADFDMLGEEARRGEDPILHSAPCLIVAHAEDSVNFPESNAALALHNATLYAQSLGLGGFLIGYLAGACNRSGALAKVLSIPKGHFVFGALALGYPRIEYKKWLQRRVPRVTWI